MQKDIIRTIIFTAISTLILEAGQIILKHNPEFLNLYMSLVAGLLITYIFKIYEN